MSLEQEVHQLIDFSLKEDIRTGDITTNTCICENAETSAKLVLKQAGVVAGLPFLDSLFKKIDPRIQVKLNIKEGSFEKAGTIIGVVSGPLRGILSGERAALNLIQHTSGIATITASYVKKVLGFDCSILDTRKTLPGLRALEKYAVKIGGGCNHRLGLDDRLIIKTNHLSYLATHVKNSLSQIVNQLKKAHPEIPVDIEIAEFERLDEALQTEADGIMLINMTIKDTKRSVEKIKKTSKKVYIEANGTITLDTVRSYAETGVNGISIGDLTHSVQALDIGMRITS